MDKHFSNPFKGQHTFAKPPSGTFAKPPSGTFAKPPSGTFAKPPSGGVTPAGAPKPSPKKHAPTKKAGTSKRGVKTPKKKAGKKRPLSKKKTAGKAKQKCFNWKESIAKNVASGILEKGAHNAAHKNQKKVNKQNRVLKKNLKAVARGKGPYSQLARGMIKDGNKKVATAAKVTTRVGRGGGGVAGAVVETGYQVYKTGGKLNRNSAVEIGAAGAVGAATTGVMLGGAAVATAAGVTVALPAVVVAGGVFATSVAVGVLLDYGLEQTGVKDKVKDRMGVPQKDRD